MGNKYLIIGTYSSQHIYNFIRVALKDTEYGSICIFSDSGDKPPEADILEYYKKIGLRVFFPQECKQTKIRLFNRLSRYASLFKAIKKVPCCEYTFIHFLSRQRALLHYGLPKKTKIIPITYGSDILRNKELDAPTFRHLFKKAYRIAFNLKNLHNVFESFYGKKYEEKCIDILFATTSLSMLKNIEKSVSRKEALDRYDLPYDKLIVLCGHTATEAERHLEMIEALKKVRKELSDKCYFVFPMSYAPGNFIPYREKIETVLEASGLNYKVIKEYVPYYDSLMIHVASDIHITSILTDALSFYLREEVYMSSALIYGNWLNYYELEQTGMRIFPYSDMEELPDVVNKVVEDYPLLKDELLDNKRKAELLMSEEAVHDRWKAVLN